MQVHKNNNPDDFGVIAQLDEPGIQTTNTTPTTLLTFTVPQGRTRWYYIEVVGDDQGSTSSVCYLRRVAIRNQNGSNARIVANSTQGYTVEDSGMSAATVNITVSGNLVTVQAVGLNGTTYTWYASVRRG